MIAIVPYALGTVAYGYYTYLYQFYNKMVMFFDAGSSTAFFTKLSAKNDRKELITFYFYALMLMFALMFGVMGLLDIFGSLSWAVPEIPEKYVYIALIYAQLFWMMQIFTKIADAYALTISVELIKIIHTVLSLLLLIFLIYSKVLDLDFYFLFLIGTTLVFLVVVAILYIKRGIFSSDLFKITFDVKKMISEFVAYCSPMFLFILTVFATGFFDLWLLQYKAGVVQTGFYGLAFQIATVSFMFTNAMTPIITREFSKYYGQNNISKMREVFVRYIPMLYAIAAYFGVFMAFEAKDILLIFTDERFYAATAAVAILALYPIHQTYGHLSGSLMLSTEQIALYRNTGVAAMLLGVVFSVILIYFMDMGATGLALKMVITQIIGVNIQLYYNAKYLGINFYHYLIHQFVVILFFAIVAFIGTNLWSFGTPIVHFFVSGVVYTVLVLAGFLLFPQLFASNKAELQRYIRKFIKRGK